MDREKGIPITYAQARECLDISTGCMVHSFWRTGFLSGADMEITRAYEILEDAGKSHKLFISDELGGALHHDVVAWDAKYEKWTYFECDAGKVKRLKSNLMLQ